MPSVPLSQRGVRPATLGQNNRSGGRDGRGSGEGGGGLVCPQDGTVLKGTINDLQGREVGRELAREGR